MTMIEQVARAIAIRWGEDPDALTGSLLNEEQKNWEDHVETARVAIEAMRTPTDAMLNATSDERNPIYSGDTIPAKDAWPMMIDAALNEQPEIK